MGPLRSCITKQIRKQRWSFTVNFATDPSIGGALKSTATVADRVSMTSSKQRSKLESKCDSAHRPESQLWCQQCLSSLRKQYDNKVINTNNRKLPKRTQVVQGSQNPSYLRQMPRCHHDTQVGNDSHAASDSSSIVSSRETWNTKTNAKTVTHPLTEL